jgi:flagellar motor switch protein FliN/FliY
MNAAHDPQETSSSSLAPLPNLGDFHAIRDVEVEITLEIGRRRMRVADVLRLAPGQTIELSKAAGEPIDIYVNGQLLGRGEVAVVSDRYSVRVTELITRENGGRP